MNAHINDNADLRYLIQEYHDGLLLYEVSKRQVWDVAATDTLGLERWFKAHRKDYAWKEPSFKGYVFHCKNAKDAKAAKKFLKAYINDNAYGEWRSAVKQRFNADSVTVSVSGPYLCTKGQNAFVDAYAFKSDKAPKTPAGFMVSGVSGKVLKQPKTWLDAKAQVTADYQADKERIWVDGLNKRFAVKLNDEVLGTLE